MHIIDTDFEPDDLVAITGIASLLSEPSNFRIVFGESDEPWRKMDEVLVFCKDLMKKFPFFSNYELYTGFASGKSFPYASKREDCSLPSWNETIYDSIGEATVWMLKPPRELLMKSKTDLQRMLKGKTARCYGSFNFRAMAQMDNALDKMNDLMSSFDAFYYFDSFTCIGQNNAHNWRAGGLIGDAIVRWNERILFECKRDLEAIENGGDQIKVDRKRKIIANIESGLHTQFVLADPCVVFAPLPELRVRLVKMIPYPVWENDERSNVFVYGDISEYATTKRRECVVNSIDFTLNKY